MQINLLVLLHFLEREHLLEGEWRNLDFIFIFLGGPIIFQSQRVATPISQSLVPAKVTSTIFAGPSCLRSRSPQMATNKKPSGQDERKQKKRKRQKRKRKEEVFTQHSHTSGRLTWVIFYLLMNLQNYYFFFFQ